MTIQNLTRRKKKNFVESFYIQQMNSACLYIILYNKKWVNVFKHSPLSELLAHDLCMLALPSTRERC